MRPGWPIGRSSALAFLLVLMVPDSAAATHASGGESDLMGLYGAAALILGFLGLLGTLELAPRPWRKRANIWGKWLLALGVIVLVGGGFHVSVLGGAEAITYEAAWGTMATQQLLGTLVVFGSFSGAAYYLARRAGVLDMGEQVKHALLRNGDPADRTAFRTAQPGEQRLMAIPIAAMAAVALLMSLGVLLSLLRFSMHVGH